MIFANGEIHPSNAQNRIFCELPEQICRTLETKTLRPDRVISALDKMGKRILSGEFSALVSDPLLSDQVQFAARMLSHEALASKLRIELGENYDAWHTSESVEGQGTYHRKTAPLGVLLHIAAGNMDALPAWSVIEGLLAGNINLLKLPQADHGMTIEFFRLLMEDLPEIRDYVYIFDTPSTDLAGIQRLAEFADGIAIWGGDAAVSALRKLAPVGCKLIEWGHRLGFCYISGKAPENELSALARHILQTRQLLCSSCQVIYLNTDDFSEVKAFSEHFLQILEREACGWSTADIGTTAELTLRRYVRELESIIADETPERLTFQGQRTSVTACPDNALELSDLNGNVLVKPLPRHQMMQILRRSKGYLQTAGLICPAEERVSLTDLLIRCGLNRVLPAGEMSAAYIGESHDGEYALRRYTRTVNVC